MSEPRIKNALPFVGLIACTGATLFLTRHFHEPLSTWAAKPQLVWSGAALLCYLATASLLLQTYAQLRNSRLVVLACLLVPLGLVQIIHHANPPRARDVTEELSGGDELEVAKAGDHRDPEPGEPPPEVETFVGLPDGVAKRHPELAGSLRQGFRTLYSFAFLCLPLLVVGTTFVPAALTARRLRFLVAVLLLAEVTLLGVVASATPETLHEPPGGAPAVVLTLSAVAALLALILWRSAAGAGGLVAGAVVFLIPPGLADAGLDPAAFGLDLKGLPHGAERAHMLAFPLVLLVAVVREWIVSMKHTTQTDALTRVFNKAYAESILAGTSGEALGSQYSVALLDIDHFKKVNDTHGHGAGDDVLREVCGTIERTIHNRGLVCRTGGEEITVFFPGLPAEQAAEICEEVRAAVEELKVQTTNNKGKKVTLAVTISLGVATNRKLNVAEGGVRKVVEAADRAVYAAKSSGRNRIVLD